MLTAETITDGEIRDLHAEVLDSDNPREMFRGHEVAATCLEALGGRHLRKSTRMQARRRCAEYINAREAADDRPPFVDCGTPISRPDDGARAAAGWSLDATSGKALPQTGAEITALLAAAGVSGSPVALYTFQEASGDIDDKVGTRDLVDAGTLTYAQTVTGWAAKGVKTSRAVAGLVENTTFGNVNATAATIYLIAQIDAVNTADATLTLFRYGDTFDDDACFEMKISGLTVIKGSIGEGDGTRTDGAVDVGDSVRIFALSCGASIAGYHDQESIGGGTRAGAGTTITFGGDNNQTNFPGDFRYVNAFVVDATHSAADVKAVMQAMGWTVPW